MQHLHVLQPNANNLVAAQTGSLRIAAVACETSHISYLAVSPAGCQVTDSSWLRRGRSDRV